MKKRKRIISLLVSFMLVFSVMIIPVNASSANPMNETVQEQFDPTAHGKVVQYGNCGSDNSSNVQYRLYEDGMLYIYGTGEMNKRITHKDIPWIHCTELYMENGITSISDSCFYECSKLKKIRLPENLTSIGEYAFAYCISLYDVSLPVSLKEIKECCFFDCESLSSIIIPEGVTVIGKMAFSCSSNLTNVVLPKSLIDIKENAFSLCSLENIVIPENVETIGKSAFTHGKFTRITIPKSIKYIDDYAFNSCLNLKEVTLPNTLKSNNIGAKVFLDNETNFRIRGDKGSYAETYAKENGFRFIDINDDTVFLSIDEINNGGILSDKNEIEESFYSRYEIIYYDKYEKEIKDIYSKPYSSIHIEAINNIAEWVVKDITTGYGILNINGESSQGSYVTIELIDPLYKEVPEPTITPTQAPTQEPTPIPVPTQAPTTTPTQVPTIAPTQAPTTAPTTAPTQEPVKLNGWVTENGKQYWYENGVKQGTEGRGKEIYDPSSDAWYWLDSIQGGAKTVSKDVYQESKADDAGNMGKWVRYDSNGHMIKGWNTNEKGTYYFDLTYGTMYKGNRTIDGVTYHFDENTGITDRKPVPNSNQNGWVTIGGKQYWYENGVCQGTEGRGKEIYDPGSDAWYWLDAVQGGAKAVSKDVYQESKAGICADRPDGTGKWVRYDANGHMVKGWNTNSSGTYYFDQIYGTMYKGTQVIDGKSYRFDEKTGILIN